MNWKSRLPGRIKCVWKINAARLYGINPEDALEKSNKKFIRRFSYVEKKAHETDRNLSDMTLEEMDEYWNEAKAIEKA